jgi:universal stress protein E
MTTPKDDESTRGPLLFSPIGDTTHLPALQEAQNFASKVDEPISVLAVVEASSTWERLTHRDVVDEFQREQRQAWESTFDGWRSEIDDLNEFELRFGSIAEEIVERSASLKASQIVLSAARTRADLNVVRRVMRLTPCPVWVLRPTGTETRRILAAVNPEPDELDLNLTILEQTARLADVLDAELHAISTWELFGEQTERRSAFLRSPIPQFHDLFSLREGITERGLAELCQIAWAGLDWTQHLANGPAGPYILAAAERLDIDILVMGTVGRSGLSGILLGNTAEDLIEAVPCSVYAVAHRQNA